MAATLREVLLVLCLALAAAVSRYQFLPAVLYPIS